MSRFLALALLFISSPALALDDDPWNDPPPDGTTQFVCAEQIEAKRAQLAQQGINLGASSGQLHVESAGFCWQAFKAGRIHTGTTSSSVTVAITGTVLSKFASLGYEAGFGQAFAPVTDAGNIQRWRFRRGYIVVHPSYGTRAIRNPLSSLWTGAGGVARFGYPTTDQIATPSGVSYSRLEHGIAASTNELGAWIDLTGNGEGRISAATKVYQHAFAGTMSARTLSSENPLVTGTQLVATGLNDQISSFTVNTPLRSSLYLYEHFPIDGRYLRVTGGDLSRIQVSNIGTFMNDRTSSMMLVNHGLAAQRITKAELVADLTAELDDLDALIEADFSSNNYDLGDVFFQWPVPSPFVVRWIPGERALELTRNGYIEVGDFWGSAHAPVVFKVKLRPFVTETAIDGDPTHRRLTIHASVLGGSMLPSGACGPTFYDYCDELEAALTTAFTSEISSRITAAFATVLDVETEDLESVQAGCMNGAGVRRVNVLPDNGLEIVVADSAAQNTCVQNLENGGWIAPLDHVRPVGLITQGYANGTAGPAFDGVRTIVPDYSLPEPPTDVYAP